MAQVYRRVRLLVSPTIVGVQLTDQQRTAQAPVGYRIARALTTSRKTPDGTDRLTIVLCPSIGLVRQLKTAYEVMAESDGVRDRDSRRLLGQERRQRETAEAERRRSDRRTIRQQT